MSLFKGIPSIFSPTCACIYLFQGSHINTSTISSVWDLLATVGFLLWLSAAFSDLDSCLIRRTHVIVTTVFYAQWFSHLLHNGEQAPWGPWASTDKLCHQRDYCSVNRCITNVSVMSPLTSSLMWGHRHSVPPADIIVRSLLTSPWHGCWYHCLDLLWRLLGKKEGIVFFSFLETRLCLIYTDTVATHFCTLPMDMGSYSTSSGLVPVLRCLMLLNDTNYSDSIPRMHLHMCDLCL
jgi:hypothetical protein